MVCYADDTIMIIQAHIHMEPESKMEEIMEKCCIALRKIGHTLSTSKTGIIVFGGGGVDRELLIKPSCRADMDLQKLMAVYQNCCKYLNSRRRIMVNAIIGAMYKNYSTVFAYHIEVNEKSVDKIHKNAVICCAKLYETARYYTAIVTSKM